MANCTISISTGSSVQEDFKLLRPHDSSANLDGQFPCGRHSGYEFKDFKLPKDLKCESCTLQLSWILNDNERIYQCSDMTLTTSDDFVPCKFPCENGGVCRSGTCQCASGFDGDYCEQECKFLNSNEVALLGDTSIMWWIIVFALIGAAIVLVFMLLKAQKSQLQR